MIKHLKFASIATRDQDRAIKFWTENVGFKVATDQPMGPGQRWIELLISGATTKVVLFTQEGDEDRIGRPFNGAFACDDVEHSYQQMKKRGVEFTQEPTKQPWGTYAIFKDPDGNSFVLSTK
jgi:predicted enzyme related to lactoylglutathione lyase